MNEEIQRLEEQYQLTSTYELADKIARSYFRIGETETALQFLINIPEEQWRPIVNQHFKETGIWHGFLFIDTGEVLHWNKFLAGDLEDESVYGGEVQTIYIYKFSEKFEVDLKIVSGDPPYVDAVLFRDGREIAVCEPGDELDGTYLFYAEVPVIHRNRNTGEKKTFQRDATFHLKVIAN